MKYLFLALLGIGFAAGVLQGITIGAQAASAMHQIYGVLWYVVAAVCLAGAGAVHFLAASSARLDEIAKYMEWLPRKES